MTASIGRLLGQALNLKPVTPQWKLDQRKSESSARGKAKRLAKKLGLDIQLERMHDGGPPIKWITAGPETDSKQLDVDWPDERAHMYWSELLSHLQDYEKRKTH
jgi:hypothetical protein